MEKEKKRLQIGFSDQCSAKDLYRDVSVPVFATLKGVREL